MAEMPRAEDLEKGDIVVGNWFLFQQEEKQAEELPG